MHFQTTSGADVAQELRDAISRFNATCKGRAPSVAMSPAFGEAGSNGTIQYYLASACDQVSVLGELHFSYNSDA
eukprot:1161345-Pelagomonas_calceolata.AAC.10